MRDPAAREDSTAGSDDATAQEPPEGVTLPENDHPDEPFVHPGRPHDPEVRALDRERNPIRRVIRIAGPGLVSGAADDDPSGIGTYAQAGAGYGFATLWLVVLVLPMMIAVQYMCARIALVTGRGLAATMRRHFPAPVLYAVVAALVFVNVVTAGADIGAMAAALRLFLPIDPSILLVAIAAGLVALQVFAKYEVISRVFRWLALVLVAYVAAGVLARPDWPAVLRGALIPTFSLDPGYIAITVAVLGTTINPYLFFWQASQEIEDQVAKGRTRLWERQGATDKELHYRAWDVGIGMFFSQFVAFFIIVGAGSTLFPTHQTNVQSAAQVAAALQPLAGPLASLLFAVGIIGTGVLAVPVLTASAAYAASETFDWPFGLAASPRHAPQFYGLIVAATVVAGAFNFAGVNPIQALVLSSLLSGLLTPPLLVVLMAIGNDVSIMDSRRNGRLMNVMGWAMTAIMGAASLAAIVLFLSRAG